ncbi:MAG: hypothetical protein IKA82_02135 [Clostridia bacterium]|nr:hypothetical protein [Clostridia bacterium]
MSEIYLTKIRKNSFRIGMGSTLDVTVTRAMIEKYPILDALCSEVINNCEEYALKALAPVLKAENAGKPSRYEYSVNISCTGHDEYRILFLTLQVILKRAGTPIKSTTFSCAADSETGYLISDKYFFSHFVKLSEDLKKDHKIRKQLIRGKLAWFASDGSNIRLENGRLIGELVKPTA